MDKTKYIRNTIKITLRYLKAGLYLVFGLFSVYIELLK